MSHFCRLIGEAAGLGEKSVEILYNASPMHDVGKIGIPDHILLKQGTLNPDEWEVMKCHPQMGADIIGQHTDELLQTAWMIALCHHEKWDGHCDPALIEPFKRALPQMLRIREQFADSHGALEDVDGVALPASA